MAMGGNGTGPQMNVTPMIDVLLVLIIIFMVIAPIKPVGFDSTVPQPSPQEAAPAPPSTVVIYVKAGGQVEVNRQPVVLGELATKLLSVFHGRPDATVFVGGDPDLEFGAIAAAIDQARGAGIRRVALLPKGSL